MTTLNVGMAVQRCKDPGRKVALAASTAYAAIAEGEGYGGMDMLQSLTSLPSGSDVGKDHLTTLQSNLAVCVWIPRFALRCEEQRRRETAERATALLAPDDLRCIWQVGSHARRFGVQRGMTVSQAVGLCPSLALWEPDPVYYDERFSQMVRALSGVSPAIEPAELGRVFVGVDGLEGLYGAAEQQVEVIRDCLGLDGNAEGPGDEEADGQRGACAASPAYSSDAVGQGYGRMSIPQSATTITSGADGGRNHHTTLASCHHTDGRGDCTSLGGWVRVAQLGWAKGKFAAWVAATKARPGEAFIVTDEMRSDFLASQPVGVLRMNPDTHRRLAQLNIKTVHDLIRLPELAVVSQFGAEGRRLWQMGVGTVVDSVVGREIPEPIVTEIDFPSPITDMAMLANALDRLIERALRHPRRAGWRVLEVGVRARQEHGASWTIRSTLKDPSADRDHIGAPLKVRLASAPSTGAVENLAVEFLTFVRGTNELQLFARDARSSARAGRRRALRTAVHEVRTRFKRSFMYRVVEVHPGSRIPERRYALIDYDP